MPRDTGIGGKAVTEDVRPGADDLSLDALRVEPGAPLGDGLDQARKERPHLEPVIKMQRRRRAVRFNDANADLLAAGDDRVDQLRWNVMGMNIDRHAPSGSVCRSAAGEIKDRASAERAFFRCQPSHDRPAAIERPLDVDREYFLPVLDRILPQLGVRSADPGVVDEYVDRRDNPERLMQGAPHRGRIAHIGGDARGAELLAGCVAGLAIEIPDHNFGSRCDKAFGYRKPQSRGATRHDGIAAVDVQLIHYCHRPRAATAPGLRSFAALTRLRLAFGMAISHMSNIAVRMAQTD